MAGEFSRPLRGLTRRIFAFPPLKTAGYYHPSRHAGLKQRRDSHFLSSGLYLCSSH